MHVDSLRRINLVELVAIGTLNHAEVHPRETYRRAVIEGSYSILVAHNHPRGEVTPSEADSKTTKRLHEAREILNSSVIVRHFESWLVQLISQQNAPPDLGLR